MGSTSCSAVPPRRLRPSGSRRGSRAAASRASRPSATPAASGSPPSGGSTRTTSPSDRRMQVGVLTGGGDCPGLNAVIRAVGRRVMDRGHELVGVHEGWKGLVEGKFEPLGPREISGLLPRGGTIIGTTRTNPYKVEGGV